MQISGEAGDGGDNSPELDGAYYFAGPPPADATCTGPNALLAQDQVAVADIVEGKPSGEKVLERLAPNPPESLVNLGILHDRRGEAKKALDFYKRAAEKGARTAKLREWIDTKDRMIGSGQSQ